MAKFVRAEVRNILGDLATEEVVSKLCVLHREVLDPILEQLDAAKKDAEKSVDLQKKLEDAEKKLADAEKIKVEYDDYKKSVESEKSRAAKEDAVRAYFEEKGIKGDNLKIAMRGAREEIGAIELADGKIKDSKAIDELIAGEFKGLVGKDVTKGASVSTPPSPGTGRKTKAEILAIKDTAERQAEIAKNLDLFQ